MSCPSHLAYDFTQIARSWGALAGILAGFAFSASIQTLTRPSGDKESDSHAIVALTAAFLTLLLATILYAILCGENAEALSRGRGESEEVLAAVVIGFGALHDVFIGRGH